MKVLTEKKLNSQAFLFQNLHHMCSANKMEHPWGRKNN